MHKNLTKNDLMAVSKLRHSLDIFFETAKKGYDNTYWIIVIIAGAGVITKLFGVGGAVASVIAFIFFYLAGVMSIRREKRLKKEKAKAKKKS